MSNVETARFDWLSHRRARLLVDVRAQFAFHYRIQKCEHLALFAANLKLNPAIWQIVHPADDIETLRDLPNGPPKSNALDIAFVKDL